MEPTTESAQKQDKCSLCGGTWDSPYTCANGEQHRFCQACVDKLNESETGLNCPFPDCGAALVT